MHQAAGAATTSVGQRYCLAIVHQAAGAATTSVGQPRHKNFDYMTRDARPYLGHPTTITIPIQYYKLLHYYFNVPIAGHRPAQIGESSHFIDFKRTKILKCID